VAEDYGLCARGEGKSQKSIEIVTRSVSYLERFLDSAGMPADVATIGHDDIRAFALYLQRKPCFADWKKQRKNLEFWYRYAREMRKRESQFEKALIETLAAQLDLPEEKTVEWLQKPWALKGLVRGEWNAEIEERRIAKGLTRLEAGLQFLNLYEILKVPPGKMKAVLDRLEQEMRGEKERQ